MGYELDYDLVTELPGRPRPLGKRGMTRLDEKKEQGKWKAEIIGYPDLDNVFHKKACNDKVARDLGIAFHKVGVEEYEEWHKKGFRVEPGECDEISKEERVRLLRLTEGSAFRKGSKR